MARRAVHATGSAIPIGYLLVAEVGWQAIRVLVIVMLVGALALETVRLLVGLDWRIFDYLTRPYEADNLAGYALFAIGMAITAVAFDPRVAVPAMLMLTIGDPVSGIVSRSSTPGRKSGPVLALVFLICVGLAWPFVPSTTAIAGALAATAADGLKPTVRGYVIDDNLTIAPAAATAMAIVTTVV
ncbi:dolichol kinase [Halococcoides cellulosivorans]|uniref:Dolichol kinase n=1 Tax=Halococcoides cellulosivorans TaxID=1679096 RepID=A0A2R4X4G9_9EURY|nr:dolichol kinase [Halococcoides cellulosivorans]